MEQLLVIASSIGLVALVYAHMMRKMMTLVLNNRMDDVRKDNSALVDALVSQAKALSEVEAKLERLNTRVKQSEEHEMQKDPTQNGELLKYLSKGALAPEDL